MPDETKFYGDRKSLVVDEPLAAGMPSAALAPTAAAIPTEQARNAPFATSQVSFSDPAGQQLAPGSLLGEYLVQRKLGEGGMGTVYAGEHPAIGKLVAIKVLAPHCANDPDLVRRFVEEARAANRIRHPNIIDIFSFGQLPDLRPYFVMEFLDGESLAEAIDKGALRPTELRRLLCQICGGLEASHQVGIVHRDLKPENIWIARPPHGESYVKLLDFGIAKLLDPTRTNLTQVATVMGTPLFMAPEQCMGREVDARTDIYALGVILYRMFAGRFPFQGTVITELVFKHMTEVPTPPSLHRQMPPDLERIILDCLAKDPVARPQSARLLADRLSAALDAWPAIAVGVATGTSALTDSTVPPPVAVLASTPVLTRPSQTTLSSPSLRPGRFLTTVPDRLCDLRVRRNADWSTSTHSAACDTSKYELPAAEKQACKARIDRANSMQDDAKRMKWIGWGTAGVGGAVFLTGVILRLLADDVDDIRVAGAGHLQPYAWTSPAGGGLGLHGNF